MLVLEEVIWSFIDPVMEAYLYQMLYLGYVSYWKLIHSSSYHTLHP